MTSESIISKTIVAPLYILLSNNWVLKHVHIVQALQRIKSMGWRETKSYTQLFVWAKWFDEMLRNEPDAEWNVYGGSDGFLRWKWRVNFSIRLKYCWSFHIYVNNRAIPYQDICPSTIPRSKCWWRWRTNCCTEREAKYCGIPVRSHYLHQVWNCFQYKLVKSIPYGYSQQRTLHVNSL